MATSQSGRLLGPDYLKVLLLILVIFGHTYTDGVAEDPVKYVIYGFHMPVFLFLSGYMLTTSRLSQQSLPQVGRRYWSRMLWQWLAVSLAFELFMGGFRGSSTSESLWLVVAEPRYHLWYVPVLMAGIVALWLIAPYRKGGIWLGVATLGGYLLFASPLRGQLDISAPIDNRYFAYLLFVWLGAAVRAGWIQPPRRAIAVVGLVLPGSALYLAGFDGSGWARSIGFLFLNLGLCLLVPWMLARLERPVPVVSGGAQLLSTYSLWVYLLHPFATEAFKASSGSTVSEVTWGTALTALIVVGALIIAYVWDHVAVRSRTASATERREQGKRD